MAGRRRKWLIAAALLPIVAALAWALLGRGGKMEVQLVFVGYTNYTKTMTNATSVFRFNTSSAMVMATNSGNVAVELYPSMRLGLDDLPMAMSANLPRILKPGETVLVEVLPQVFRIPWSVEFMAQRRGLQDRLYVKAIAKRGTGVQRLITKWFPPPPSVWPTLAITNSPELR